MNKIKYVKNFNLALSSLFWGLLFSVMTILLSMLMVFNPFQNLMLVLDNLVFYSYLTSSVFIIICFTLVVIELTNRIRKDSIYNFIHSLHMSLRIRDFLEKENDLEDGMSIKVRKFNKSVKKAVINVNNTNVCLYIKLPINVESQQLVKNIQEELKEQMASDFPRYFFSDYSKEEGYLILVGSKS